MIPLVNEYNIDRFLVDVRVLIRFADVTYVDILSHVLSMFSTLVFADDAGSHCWDFPALLFNFCSLFLLSY